MSIYATLWTLKFPRDDGFWPDAEWVTVMAQGVPPHIGSPSPGQGYEEGDPYAQFLPPAVETDAGGEADYFRAVVFVVAGTAKGTERSGQEYADTLLVLTGEAYAHMTFAVLEDRLRHAVRK